MMIKFTIRVTLLAVITCLSSTLVKAQIGYDYAQYDLGASIGFNQFYGDVSSSKSTNAVNFNFNYNQTPYLNYIVEFQAGKLGGGDMNKDLLGRQFSTDYNYYAFRIQLQAGEIMDYSQSRFKNAIKNFYVGLGIGVVYNKVTQINRYSIVKPGYYTPGVLNSNQLFIPLRFGYEFKIFNQYRQPGIKLDIGYQTNFILGDNIDGFKAGTHNDLFGQFVIGAKFSIGGVTSYRKEIMY